VVDGARSRRRIAGRLPDVIGSNEQIATIGLDIAKNVFQVHDRLALTTLNARALLAEPQKAKAPLGEAGLSNQSVAGVSGR
jgi:hypothetical protein